MTVALLPAEMHGHWTHCEPQVCEFQCGTTMIYVSYSDDKSMESRLAVARTTVEAVFDEIHNALEFARQISERRNAEFWLNAKRISLKQSPLTVFAIRYPLDSDLPIYEISWNPIFEPEVGFALSEDWIEEQVLVNHLPENDDVVYIKRLGVQRYAEVG